MGRPFSQWARGRNQFCPFCSVHRALLWTCRDRTHWLERCRPNRSWYDGTHNPYDVPIPFVLDSLKPGPSRWPVHLPRLLWGIYAERFRFPRLYPLQTQWRSVIKFQGNPVRGQRPPTHPRDRWQVFLCNSQTISKSKHRGVSFYQVLGHLRCFWLTDGRVQGWTPF